MFNFKKRKGYLTMPEAANFFSSISDETICEADIYGAALNGQLNLSVRFSSGSYAKRCNAISHAEQLEIQRVIDAFKIKIEQEISDGKKLINIEVQTRLKDELGGISDLIFISEGRVLAVVDEIIELTSEPYDLSMDGNEKFCIDKIFRSLTGAAPPGLLNDKGILVTTHDGSQYFQLQNLQAARDLDRVIYYPEYGRDATYYIGTLPIDAEIVVRTEVLLKFEYSINGGPAKVDVPLGTKERNTLLSIIAVLCKEAKFDYRKTSKSAGLIKNAAALMDINIGETTIEEHLKKIPNAVETRMK